MLYKQLALTIPLLLAQGAAPAWGLGQILIAIIVVAACVAIVLLALRNFGIAIPPFVIQAFWIVLIAFIAIIAIKFLLSF